MQKLAVLGLLLLLTSCTTNRTATPHTTWDINNTMATDTNSYLVPVDYEQITPNYGGIEPRLVRDPVVFEGYQY